MTFSEQLNTYIEDFSCSSQELSNASGLSAAVISRYRKGDRTPSLRSPQLEQLSVGLFKIGISKVKSISKEEIYNTFSICLNDVLIDYEQLSKNFNSLISSLNISVAELSRFIGYDASFVSKIRSGNKSPSKPKDFVEAVCNFIVTKYKEENSKRSISSLIGCSLEELESQEQYLSKLINWFSSNSDSSSNCVNNFLNNLDTFDLNEYIRAIHFDKLKLPSIHFNKMISKSYFGIEEMKKGELDFFRATVFSKSKEPVFMCNDMPIHDMAKDLDFGKKWMLAIAVSIKKGLHVNVIHNIDRPFNEIMLGLESWIPLYMTGQVSPYYFKNPTNNVYCHLNYVSGSVALTGDCISGYHSKGKYFLAAGKSEVDYYKTKAEYLLKKATPLLDIYRSDSQSKFNTFLEASLDSPKKRRRILTSLPIHTISDDLLIRILKRNKLDDATIEKVVFDVHTQQRFFNTVIKNNIMQDDYAEISEANFSEVQPTLFLADCFCDQKVYYTYDEYLEHLAQAKAFSKKTKNYKLIPGYNHIFKNIQLSVLEDTWVIVSKATSPTIHFVVHHPKLRNAIENFIPPIVE